MRKSSSVPFHTQTKMLWVDKHRPTSLDALDFHKEQAAQLRELAKAGDLPHLLFFGPSGAGKKTRIMALLREIFGASVERVKLEHKPFKTPSGKPVEMTTVASSHHIEINPGDAGIYDRYVVQDIIKEMAQYNPIEGARSWKVLLLSEVDRLTKEAQAALRRTMERYTATCRLILVTNSASNVIEPVRSRCLGLRVPAPSNAEVMTVLASVARKEGFTLPPPVAARIASQCGRNLRRAVLMLEAAYVANPTLTTNTILPVMDWERYVQQVAVDVLREQSPRQLAVIRNRLYDLLVNCVPADAIVRRLEYVLVADLGRGLPDPVKHEIAHWCAYYEHRLQLGSKELFHLEALFAKLMVTLRAAQHHTAPLPGTANPPTTSVVNVT